MGNQLITVSSALAKIADGEMLDGYVVDFDYIKVEALDAMKLSKAGITVPETAIYYDDTDTEFDEDFEGDWKQVPVSSKLEEPIMKDISITINEDMEVWLNSQNIELEILIENLLNSFYQTQRLFSEKK